ncbi:MAG: hypothetical protein J6P05_01190 [Lachnospiraceae bacterium]|nr:hypothetical protein [Lachnospiraceae bacterium]
MVGEYKVRVRNSRNSYSFSLKRNITILRGESGRGKTTLFEMILEHNRFGKSSGVSISCDRGLLALSQERWDEEISKNPGKIIVIDEDSRFIKSKAFAETVREKDNYFLLITRNYLDQLPISVEEIYELYGAKNKRFRRIYKNIDRMYDDPPRAYLPFRPDIIITEDSGSGFQFFKKMADDLGMKCESSGGKSNLLRVMNKYPDKNVALIADGAAIGSEIADLAKQQSLRPKKIAIYLPESFEWIILGAGIVGGVDRAKIDMPERFADSMDYMSWEQYFTDILIKATKNTVFQRYDKAKLPDFYLQDGVQSRVKGFIKGIDLSLLKGFEE